MVIITIGHDLMAQAQELFCRRCWLLSAAGSRERKCGTGLWCVAAAAVAREDDIDRSKLTYYRSVVEIGHLSDLSLLLISIRISHLNQDSLCLVDDEMQKYKTYDA